MTKSERETGIYEDRMIQSERQTDKQRVRDGCTRSFSRYSVPQHFLL